MDVRNTSFTFYNSQVAFNCLLKAFCIGKQDRVLIPAYTDSFIPLTIYHTAADPEYADIDPQNYNSLLSHYTEAYERMKSNGTASFLTAVLIHHAYGSPNPDTDKIVAWAKDKGLLVIEYCTYGPQLSQNGKPLGTSGDGAFFTFGVQGIAQVNNPKYQNIMSAMETVAPPPTKTESLSLATTLFIQQLLLRSRHCRLASQLFIKSNQLFDINHWDTQLEATPRNLFRGIGYIQRKVSTYYANRFDTIVNSKIQLAAYYSELLRARGLPVYNYEADSILSAYPVRLKNKQECLALAKAAGFELGQGWDYPLYSNSDDSLLPNAHAAAKEVVCLPLHEQITQPDAEKLINFLDSLQKGTIGGIMPEFPLQSSYKIPHVSELLERISKAAPSIRKIPWFS